MLLETRFVINTRILSFFLFMTAALAGADFERVQDDFFAGKYHSVLKEYDSLSKKWLEEGVFDEYLQKRREMARSTFEQRRALERIKKNRSKELKRIEEDKNSELQFLCDRYPDLAITSLLRDILNYHKLREKHSEALEFYSCLELGVVSSMRDPVVAKLQKILQDFDIKTIVVSSQVVNCEIDQETAYLYKTLLDLDRIDLLRDICRAQPDSEAAKLCLEALEVQYAMLPVFLNQKYLSDLLVGARPPANIAEDRARQVLQLAHVRREGLLAQK